MLSKRVEGKFAVVTGAGSGMGEAIAIRLASEGAVVAVLDIDTDRARAVTETIAGAGGFAFAVTVDISSRESVTDAAASVLRELDLVHGRYPQSKLDILVNNAGILDQYLPLLETTDELWDRVIGINLSGMFSVTKAFLPQMIAGGGGSVINTSSIAGHVAGGGGAAYTSAKHGVIGFTKQLAFDYGRLGIRANSILPGAVETSMTRELFATGAAANMDAVRAVPAGRFAQPDEIANLALFLASDESSFIYGASYVIDGGWTIS